MRMRSIIRPIVPVALLLASASCELGVTNLNQPDRDRALAQAGDVEALIAGTFGVFFNATHNETTVVNLFAGYASDLTGVATGGAGWSQGVEPRIAFENSPDVPGASGAIGPRIFWPAMLQIVSSVNDGFAAIENRGLTLMEGDRDVTVRARAFGLFMQGVAWGYLAMLYDTPILVREAAGNNPTQQAIDGITPWQEARDAAIAALDEAIALGQQNVFTFPSSSSTRLWFGTPEPMSNTQFVRLANTLAARILVLSARTPAQRLEVDWNRVLSYTANGLQADFAVTLAPNIRTSLVLARAQSNTPGCAACFRLNTRLLGLADTGGKYQEWLATPIEQRTRFDITTPDRRITGATPQSAGAYTRYFADNNGFPPGFGTYRQSAYQWARHLHGGFQANSGAAKLVTVDENVLLRAEAMLRTGNLAEAAQLINVTRTRSHTLPNAVTHPGLPPVTAAGVPQSATCVPRRESGACGDLLTALRYERLLELVALDAVRGYAESRGFGMLPDGSWLQLPIPGIELEVLGIGLYTYGGVGTEWGAVFAPAQLP